MTGPLGLPRVLWAALFASTLIYILVLDLMTPEAVSDWQALMLVRFPTKEKLDAFST